MKRRLVLAPIVAAHDPAAPGGENGFAAAAYELTSRPDFSDRGITWSIPARWWERDDEPLRTALELIRTRVLSGLDGVAPCGYSGAHHGALLAAELERELGWAVENPWGSGIRPSFPAQTTMLFSTRIDLARESALERYLSAFDVVFSGLQRTANPRLDDLLVYHSGVARRMSAASLEETPVDRRSGIRRTASAVLQAKDARVALILPVGSGRPESVFRFLALLERLRRRRSVSLAAVSEPLILECDTDHHAVPQIKPAGPHDLSLDAERAIRAASTMRGDRMGVAQTRTLLTALADASIAEPDVEGPPPKREYIASMMGDATISDDAMEISFEGGNLRGVSDDEGPLLLNVPTAGWVETDRRRHAFTISNAFSYEAPHCRGLSTMATAAGLAGTTAVRMDASFVEGFPWFVLDLRVDTPPPGPSVHSLTPMVIALTDCTHGHCLEIESLYPDGEVGHTFIEAGRGENTVTVWGALFRIRWGDRCLSVGYPALHGKTVAPITVRAVPLRRGRARMELHPAGYFMTNVPELISARSYRVTFGIAPGEPDAETMLRPPAALAHCLPNAGNAS